MERVSIDDISNPKAVYLPHHAVIKDTSTSTRLRVVFDASFSTTSGNSLNDCLLTGPRLQEELFNITIRWRKYKFAMTADIEKMYRQIQIHQDDADYQRILWRNDTNKLIHIFRLMTATFGTSCAPFLAIKTIQTLAKLEEQNFPIGSKVILNDCIYVSTYLRIDDLLFGADTEHEATIKQNESIQLLRAGCLELKKWTSNTESLLVNIPPENRETKLPLNFNIDKTFKTLGLYWNPATDEFEFQICLPPKTENLTKRSLLSDIAKIFDPIGWLSPVTIKAKIILQSLWLTNLDWDDQLSDEIIKTWIEYRDQLHLLQNIKIPRWLGTMRIDPVEIHIFSDASIHAYAAVAYIRIEKSDGTIHTQIMSAKTKVAPIKQISLAKLELCGAVLGARLGQKIMKSMKFEEVSIHAWTDSTIVLCWLRAHPSRWKIFIANRVVEINESIPSNEWRHVRSSENPADAASRGILPAELQEHSMWWTGPSWLQKSKDEWPQQPVIGSTQIEERNIKVMVVNQRSTIYKMIQNCSKYIKLIRSTAYLFRFINNINSKNTKKSGYLSTNELSAAAIFWIKEEQKIEYSKEILHLNRPGNNSQVSSKSKLLSLNPFVDDQGLLRVGGRLEHTNLNFDKKHPIILPPKSRLTNLIIDHTHTQTLHGGPQLVLNTNYTSPIIQVY